MTVWGGHSCPPMPGSKRTSEREGTQIKLQAGGQECPPHTLLQTVSLDARVLFLHRLIRPGHARSVVRDADVSRRVEHDDAAMPVDALFQIIHRFLRGPLREISRRDPVGSPLGEHELHDGLSPSGG